MISQDELVAAYPRDEIHDLKAVDVMREDIPQVPADIPLKVAAQIMRDQGVRVMFLTHHAAGITYPAAVISYRHLVRHLAAAENEDLGDLGIKAKREAPLDSFIKRRDKARSERTNN
jgi:CBS domain-containing protein